MLSLEFLATLQPNFPHFRRFARDNRLGGIRLNNPHWTPEELKSELAAAKALKPSVPLYFDVKGWQLRVIETHVNDHYLDITLNHPISVDLPTVVIFKAGADSALLERIEEGGRRLIFRGGPKYLVKPGESLQIRSPSLEVLGEQFTPEEIAKVEVARAAGIDKFFLSYVSSKRDVERFRELVGKESAVRLKIENQQGLEYVAKQFRKEENTQLVAARGDLYVEVARPHEIMDALQLIISRDPKACVGSRIMLSVIHEPVPSCADFLELAWLYDTGYRSMLLCDELCLNGDLLGTAINACESFAKNYHPKSTRPETSVRPKTSSFWKRWFLPSETELSHS